MINLSCMLFAMILNVFLSSANLEDCKDALTDMFTSGDANSLEMIYYSGKDSNDLGQYGECNELKDASYSLLIINRDPTNLYLGICGPSICQPEDYKTLINYVLPIFIQKGAEIDSSQTSVYQSESYNRRSIGKAALAFIIFTVIIICITAVGTYLELVSSKFPGKDMNLKHPILLSFSLRKNFYSLISLPETTNNLQVFTGLKILSILSISLFHCYIYQNNIPSTNPSILTEFIQSFSHRIIYMSIYMFDILFITSGFFLAYLVIGKMNALKGKINWPLFYVHRLLRVVPVYFYIFIFFVFIFPYTGTGPAWPIQEYLTKSSCDNYWYSNLLFINNFLPINEYSCMS